MPGVIDGEINWYDLDSNFSDSELPYLQEDMSRRRDIKGEMPRLQYPNGFGPDPHDNAEGPVHMLEHLATFSVGPQYGLISPKDGLRRLLHMEKTSGIWTQKMQMRLDSNWVIIIDYENGDVVEKFPMNLISEPTAYTSDDPREIYNNILIFIVREDPKAKNHSPSEMHIFQCVRIYAQDIVDEIKTFMSGKAKGKYSDLCHLPPPPSVPPPEPPVNGRSSNIGEQGGLFNSQYSHHRESSGSQHRLDRSERASFTRESNDETSSTASDKYEREVAILNHCFDDIEKFVARLQHAAAAYKELERRQKSRKNKKKDMGDGMLSIRAKPPPDREFVDILQKFKFSFNLLAKLKSHIHDPNAPELVHFVFTPLALIVDAARDESHNANLTARVVTPLLTREAIDLLTNCCTSKETDLWHSLGDAWIIPRDQWKDCERPYYPVFSNGWAPDNPLEDRVEDTMARRLHRDEIRRAHDDQEYQRVFNHPERDICYGSEFGSEGGDRVHSEVGLSDPPHLRQSYKPRQSDLSRSEMQRGGTLSPSSERDFHDAQDRDEVSSDSTEQVDLHLDPQRQFERHQLQWLEELKSRGSKIAQVVYPRSANNDKELTVMRGEFLEVLDDNRKWWKARNMSGQVAHVPHTIVAPYPGGVLDEDVFNNPLYATRGSSRDSYYGTGESLKDGNTGISQDAPRPPPISPPAPAPADWVRRERQGRKGEFRYF